MKIMKTFLFPPSVTVAFNGRKYSFLKLVKSQN